MRCAGCSREMKEGDLCIKGRPTEFIHKEADPFVDKLVAQILSGNKDTEEIVYCQACTVHGGGFDLEVYHEEETE